MLKERILSRRKVSWSQVLMLKGNFLKRLIYLTALSRLSTLTSARKSTSLEAKLQRLNTSSVYSPKKWHIMSVQATKFKRSSRKRKRFRQSENKMKLGQSKLFLMMSTHRLLPLIATCEWCKRKRLNKKRLRLSSSRFMQRVSRCWRTSWSIQKRKLKL